MNIKKRVLRIVSLGVFFLGIGMMIAYFFDGDILKAKTKMIPFKITFHQYEENENGKITRAIIKREQNIYGEWKETTSWFDIEGRNIVKTVEEYAINGRGLLKVDEDKKRLIYIGLRPDKPMVKTLESFTSDPDFVREDNFAGYRVFVSRYPIAEKAYDEYWYSPELQGVALKIIFVGTYKTVVEAVEIETDVEIAPFKVPDYPVDMSKFREIEGKMTK